MDNVNKTLAVHALNTLALCYLPGKEGDGGDIGLFITLVPKVLCESYGIIFLWTMSTRQWQYMPSTLWHFAFFQVKEGMEVTLGCLLH